MNISTEEFMKLHSGMSAKDVENAQLRAENEQLRAECELWKARALDLGFNVENLEEKSRSKKGFLVISLQKLCKLLSKIHDIKLVSVVITLLQKSLSDASSAEDCKELSEIMPMPQLPTISLQADGDVNVEGNWNDVHDNNAINY